MSKIFDLPYATPTMHEFVLSDKLQKVTGATTIDMAKALMEYGFHPPTVYFPLVVPGAIMIEPTESEPLSELKRFAQAMESVAARAANSPEALHEGPCGMPVTRVDEVRAARNLILTWKDLNPSG
jgi:glycine dehydrogenase subunit 2